MRGIVVDTAFFRGNYPEHCSLDGCNARKGIAAEQLAADASLGLRWSVVESLPVAEPIKLGEGELAVADRRLSEPGANSRHVGEAGAQARDLGQAARDQRGARVVERGLRGQQVEETSFARWMFNTMFIALVSTIISLFCGVIGGYALARLRFGWAGLLGTAIFVTYLVPQTLLFIPLADVIRNFGLGDTPWALILTYPTFLIPFCTWLLMGYFRTVPKEVEECAMVDGCTRFQALVRIVLPVAIPGIVCAVLFAFTISWNEFIYALTFINTTDKKTVPGPGR